MINRDKDSRHKKQQRTSLRKLYGAVCEMLLQFFCLLPVKNNKIVFDNFGGRGYGCDPKYIAEELLKSKRDLDLVWLTQDVHTALPNGIRPVWYGGVRAIYELATAKVWVDNVKSALRIPKKRNQLYIQTWHSSLGLKKNEQDADILPNSYVRRAKRDAGMTDLMYSNNSFREDKYRNRFWYQGKVIRCGIPRNGILLHRQERVVNKVKDYFHIDKDKKLVLYAPTFRAKAGSEIYEFDIVQVIRALDLRFHGEHVCLRRLHPNVADLGRKITDTDLIRQATEYPDIQELLAAADVLITDYSGCMFEYMLTGKPVFLLIQDYEDYLKKERKLYFAIKELPFEAAFNEQDLLDRIKNFNMERYLDQCRNFMQLVGMEDDGNGAKVLANIIIKNIDEEAYGD